MTWREIYARLYPVAATAIAWAPNTNAADSSETLAAAVGDEAAVFRMEGFGAGGGGGGVSGGGGGGSSVAGDGADGRLRTRRSATLPHPAAVHGVDWNMVGSTLATAAADGVVRLWSANLQTAKWQAGPSYLTARS